MTPERWYEKPCVLHGSAILSLFILLLIVQNVGSVESPATVTGQSIAVVRESGVNIWTVIGTSLAAATAVITVTTAYLRIFMKAELGENRRELVKEIKAEFAQKELMQAQFQAMIQQFSEIARRINSLEAQLSQQRIIAPPSPLPTVVGGGTVLGNVSGV